MATLFRLQPDGSYAISAGKILCRAGKAPIIGGTILVRFGRIQSVLGAGDTAAPEPLPSGWDGIDLRDMLLAPGLIDAHVHLGLRNAEPLFAKVQRCVEAGVLGLRDGGDPRARTLEDRERLLALGVRVHASGWAICRRGAYGRFLGREISTRPEFEGILSELVSRGVDFIKIIASGMVDFRAAGVPNPLPFSETELAWMVETARRSGLGVMVHANTDAAVTMAIRAGVRSIEHGYLISRESIMRMADGGVYWVPTLLPVFLLGESKGFREDHPACAMENLRRIYGRHEENLALAHEVGVRIVAGTDAGASGIEPGPSVYAELNLMRRAGLPVEAVLDAATRYPGEMMESANGILMGSIDPGREARFVVLPPEVPGGFWEPEDVLGVVTVV